jgi:hypothetical protein
MFYIKICKIKCLTISRVTVLTSSSWLQVLDKETNIHWTDDAGRMASSNCTYYIYQKKGGEGAQKPRDSGNFLSNFFFRKFLLTNSAGFMLGRWLCLFVLLIQCQVDHRVYQCSPLVLLSAWFFCVRSLSVMLKYGRHVFPEWFLSSQTPLRLSQIWQSCVSWVVFELTNPMTSVSNMTVMCFLSGLWAHKSHDVSLKYDSHVFPEWFVSSQTPWRRSQIWQSCVSPSGLRAHKPHDVR